MSRFLQVNHKEKITEKCKKRAIYALQVKQMLG